MKCASSQQLYFSIQIDFYKIFHWVKTVDSPQWHKTTIQITRLVWYVGGCPTWRSKRKPPCKHITSVSPAFQLIIFWTIIKISVKFKMQRNELWNPKTREKELPKQPFFSFIIYPFNFYRFSNTQPRKLTVDFCVCIWVLPASIEDCLATDN